MKWWIFFFVLLTLRLDTVVAAPISQDEDAEFDKATLEGTVEETATGAGSGTPTLEFKARFDAAFSGGEPTQQGFTIPHFFFSADGVANPWMTYRLTMSPSREYSTALIPNLVPTEAFIRLASLSAAEAQDTAGLSATFGLMSPTFNPWWSPDIGELWVPDFFYGQRLLLLSRDIGIEFSANPIPRRVEMTAGYFNGNGIFGFNTNNSRAVTGFARVHLIPPASWRLYIGSGFFHFAQGTAGGSNHRTQWVLNPFVGVEADVLSLSLQLEGWWGGYLDSSRSKSPKGLIGTLKLGHPRLQVFVRYMNLASVPTSGGFLSELHTGMVSDPFPHLKMFFYYQQVKGRSTGVENSVNLRARFAL